MILAIDVGNTNIVIGCLDQGSIRNVTRIETHINSTVSEYELTLHQIFQYRGIEPRSLEGAIIGSVVPPVTERLSEAVKNVTGLECLIVGPGMKTGMNIRIDDPSTLAADLLAGSVAAMLLYGKPTLILDMGTASTLFAVDRSGAFIGGAIIPGVALSYRALASGTSLLPEISITPPKKCIATNTVDCMRSGAVYATAAMVDGLIERFEAELGEKCTVVATGGIARHIIPYCRREIIFDDDLMMKGLWILYKKNT